jgi:hypothetical protein
VTVLIPASEAAEGLARPLPAPAEIPCSQAEEQAGHLELEVRQVRHAGPLFPEGSPPWSAQVVAAPLGCRADARVQLRAAHEMLAVMGAGAFAERARRELLATGETARKRTAQAPDTLTAQETSIAGLARTGRPARRSAPTCSCPPGPWNGTCARSSPSSRSARAGNCPRHWPASAR